MFTRIELSTIVRKLPAFTTYSNNVIQYREPAPHNTMIDIDCTARGETCTVAELVAEHGTDPAVYRAALPLLARDGYIALESSDTAFKAVQPPKGADYAAPGFYDLALAPETDGEE